MKPGCVAIVGGSVAGLFAGVILRREGWNVKLYERSRSGLQGRGAGLVPQSEVADILREIGRSDVLRSGVVAQERIFLDRSGELLGLIATPQAQISWDLLFAAFRADIPPGDYRQARAVVGVSSTESQGTVQFSDGTSEGADLVIGADGIASVVRESVAPATHPEFAGYAAFRGLAPESQLPPKSAAMLRDRFAFLRCPTHAGARLPCGGGRRQHETWRAAVQLGVVSNDEPRAIGSGTYVRHRKAASVFRAAWQPFDRHTA